jgi:hypothetical protein
MTNQERITSNRLRFIPIELSQSSASILICRAVHDGMGGFSIVKFSVLKRGDRSGRRSERSSLSLCGPVCDPPRLLLSPLPPCCDSTSRMKGFVPTTRVSGDVSPVAQFISVSHFGLNPQSFETPIRARSAPLNPQNWPHQFT